MVHLYVAMVLLAGRLRDDRGSDTLEKAIGIMLVALIAGILTPIFGENAQAIAKAVSTFIMESLF